ncbi:MAG TPA: CBS domain-containing protein [Geminicoccaceae bacterium]|nr:CBS domain-containing protein [Geminicoccaceae bacterium]
MQLKDVMTKDVKLANPDMTLKEAAAQMRDGDFGVLPVGENDRLVGVITDRDITIRAVAARGAAPVPARVGGRAGELLGDVGNQR